MTEQSCFCDAAVKHVAVALVHLGQAEVLEREAGRPEYADDPVTAHEVFDEYRAAYLDFLAAGHLERERLERYPHDPEFAKNVAFLNSEAIRAARAALAVKEAAK